jgi:hypothetical protein
MKWRSKEVRDWSKKTMLVRCGSARKELYLIYRVRKGAYLSNPVGGRSDFCGLAVEFEDPKRTFVGKAYEEVLVVGCDLHNEWLVVPSLVLDGSVFNRVTFPFVKVYLIELLVVDNNQVHWQLNPLKPNNFGYSLLFTTDGPGVAHDLLGFNRVNE